MHGGPMMTTSREREPETIGETGSYAWWVAMTVARQERPHRSQRYAGRHRWAPAEHADTQDVTERTA